MIDAAAACPERSCTKEFLTSWPDRGWWCKFFYRHPDLLHMEIKLLKWAFHYIVSETNLETEDDVECGSLFLVLASHWFHNRYRWLSLNGFLHRIQGSGFGVESPTWLDMSDQKTSWTVTQSSCRCDQWKMSSWGFLMLIKVSPWVDCAEDWALLRSWERISWCSIPHAISWALISASSLGKDRVLLSFQEHFKGLFSAIKVF